MEELLYKLYDQIKHGDEEHQAWLKDKIDEFLTRHQNEYLIYTVNDIERDLYQ